METLTRAQMEKWSEKLENGYTFDARHYIMWGEKEIHKYINLTADGTKKLEIRILYREETETITNEWGCKWTRGTGRQIATIHLAEWIADGAMMHSFGLGQWITAEGIPPQDKKNYNVLVKLSQTLTDAEIMQKFRRCESWDDAESLAKIG